MNKRITDGEYDTALASIHSMGAKRLLDIPQVAAQLGCGKSLVYQLIADGKLASIKLGRLTRVPDSVVERFIDDALAAGHAS